MTIRTLALAVSASALAFSAASASAQIAAPSPAGQAATLPVASSVTAFYNTWRASALWFRGGVANPAAARLSEILRRAPLDGFGPGPQLAAAVDAAVRQAASGKPADVALAERTLSSAWVQYVQALRQPTPGMAYAYAMLKPQSRADQILLTAAAAPSLEQHLVQVSNVNPIYAEIRNAALAEALATGNFTPDPRLLANLERARTFPATGRYAVVDSISQRMTMFDGGRPVDSMKVIVGTDEFPTPMIASFIHYVTLNPYWNAPDHLVRRAIAPNVLSQGFGYLKSRGYEAMADWTEESAVIPPEKVDWKAVVAGKIQLRIRQQPGPKNFMATMKIPFLNDDDIYLHDTPTKSLFDKASRDLSNGCVRLEDAPRFARWLLGYDPVAKSADPEQHVTLPRGVPIFLTYLTAQPKDGKLTYAADIYGLDKAATKRLAAR